METAAEKPPEFPDLILANLALAYALNTEPPTRFNVLLERLAELYRMPCTDKPVFPRHAAAGRE